MLRYCGPFVFLVSVPILYYCAGPTGPFATVVALLAILVGAEICSHRGDAQMPSNHLRRFRLLIILYIPLQIGLIIWAAAVSASTTLAGFFALVLSVGVTTGVFGMLTAHEAIHSTDPLERMLGTAMLSGMTYRHFRIAHVHGHHRWAATNKDPGAAKLGEGFYHFLLRTVKDQFVLALDFERGRCSIQKLSFAKNKVVGDIAISVLLLTAIAYWTGPRGIAFFVLQSAIAIIVLELFNYIAHYGLMRCISDEGRPEALKAVHSWNSSNIFANSLIFNMGRHSFHHGQPSASYQSLKQIEFAPELPFGYAGSIILALVPPLWRRVMDPNVHQVQARCG